MGVVFTAIATAVEAIGGLTIVGDLTVGALLTDVAVSAALSIASSLLLRPSLNSEAQKQVFRQAVTPRRRYVGRVKVGGPWAFLDDREGLFYQVVLINSGNFVFTAHWLGEDQVTVDGDGAVLTPDRYQRSGVDWAYIDTRPGTATDTAFERLTAAFPEWTTAHTLPGIASVLVTLRSPSAANFTKIFPAGLPQYNAVGNAGLFFDPADEAQSVDDPSTWTFTMNGVRIVMDYLWHADGMRLPWAMIDKALDDNWIPQMAIADEAIALKAGGTEPRYRLSGGYELTAPPKQVLPQMLAPMDAQLYLRGDGAICIDVGKFASPSVTLNDAEITGYQDLAPREREDLRNQVSAKFVSEDYDFEEQEADLWVNAASVAVDGPQATTLDLTWCPSHAQSRRIQKINACRLGPALAGTITTNAGGMRLWGERRVHITSPAMGIDADFEILKFAQDTRTGTCTVQIVQMGADAYSWDAASEEGTAPNMADDNETLPVEEPDSLTADVAAYVTGGTISAIIAASVPAPGVLSLTLEMQYRTHDGGVSDDDALWTALSVDQDTWSGTTEILPDGTYDVRARFVAADGTDGDWVYDRSIVVDYDALPPTAPTDADVAPGTGDAMVSWRNPVSANFAYCVVFRGPNTGDFADASSVSGHIGGGLGEAKSYHDTPITPGDYDWWIVAYTADDVGAAPVGPLTGTVT
jgi:hypothetical protein